MVAEGNAVVALATPWSPKVTLTGCDSNAYLVAEGNASPKVTLVAAGNAVVTEGDADAKAVGRSHSSEASIARGAGVSGAGRSHA